MSSSTYRTDAVAGSPVSSVVDLAHVGKRFNLFRAAGPVRPAASSFWALKDVTVSAGPGTVLGIIGRNGAGKTTLLSIIAGTLEPDEGQAAVRGRVIGLFNLGAGFQDELSGRENIYLNGAILGAGRRELESKMADILDFCELGEFIDMPLGSYSQGMRLRLGFSVIVNLECDVMVIDEILAVGDTLFQNKCFERLMELKRSGKTLIITSQSMELIERLCDRVLLLTHGRADFIGAPAQAAARYSALLHSEKFFVGPERTEVRLVEDTKKWSDDISTWGRELGTKEIVIKKVELLNRFGKKVSAIRPGGALRIKVQFRSRNAVNGPHFGVAIFREDGVYCYGPNTRFDGRSIPELRPGDGQFVLEYDSVWLAPGEYRLSVAVWDAHETVAYAYHHGCYRLLITGADNPGGQLTAIPFSGPRYGFLRSRLPQPDLLHLDGAQGDAAETDIDMLQSVRLLDRFGRERSVMRTCEPAVIAVDLRQPQRHKGGHLWVGLYRDDGVLCQGCTRPLGNQSGYALRIPEMALLPGGYTLSAGVWDESARAFTARPRCVYQFRMVFDRGDHGTVYLRHRWSWKLP